MGEPFPLLAGPNPSKRDPSEIFKATNHCYEHLRVHARPQREQR